MDAQVKAKWVAALKSGDYKQGRGALHSPYGNTFCCLGVLCHLAAEEGVVKEHADGSYDYGALYVLPSKVALWAGLVDTERGPVASPDVPEPIDVDDMHYDKGNLASFNDNGYDFDYIADLIERYL